MKFSRTYCLVFLACVGFGASPTLATGDCSDYTDLSGLGLPITVTGTTADATGDYGPFAEQPACWQGYWTTGCAASLDVTYKWTAPHDGRFTFTLVGSSSNADLLIYTFTCPGEPLYPDDYLCGSHHSLPYFDNNAVRELELIAGQEILIVVDGTWFWNGEFILRIHDNTTLSDSLAMGMDFYHYPGMSAACAWSGTGRWRDNLGLANIDEGLPVDEHHLFRVYSVSKLVTATALMQLWEDGLFDLDDDVGDYLPFAVRHPAYPEIPITFRMLMAHVSGIIRNQQMFNLTFVPEGDPTVTPCEFMEGYVTPGGTYFDADANFTPEAPGTVYVYSGAGVTLMGCLIEQINPQGLTFEDYCRAHIFDPLQMPASAFLYSSIDPADMVTHYSLSIPNYIPLVPGNQVRYPANGLRTNARELSRFMLACLRGGELYGQRILDAATVDSMLTVQYPEITNDQMGLSWFRQQIGDRWVWGHHGGGYPARAGFWISRDEGLGVIAMTNCGGSADFSGILDINDMQFLRAAEWAMGEVGVPDGLPVSPALVQLGPCYPNPFNPRTSIRFGLPNAGHARLTIYDLRGRLVTTLLDEPVPAGHHSATWYGRDAAGRESPSGTYLVRLETEDRVEARKVMLLR